MKRYGSVIGLKAEKLDEYKKLHSAVWPEVWQIRSSTDYSVFKELRTTHFSN